MSVIYDFAVRTLAGQDGRLSGYKGQVLLIVNTASKCGFTPQYEELENLFRRHHAQGFAVLGFPCNQFGAQEPGSAEEIGHFCQANYGVTFPMFARIDVNGPNAHPLYKYLKREKPGLFGSRIKWNFTKFLIDRSGRVVARYAPATKPKKIEKPIVKLL